MGIAIWSFAAWFVVKSCHPTLDNILNKLTIQKSTVILQHLISKQHAAPSGDKNQNQAVWHYPLINYLDRRPKEQLFQLDNKWPHWEYHLLPEIAKFFFIVSKDSTNFLKISWEKRLAPKNFYIFCIALKNALKCKFWKLKDEKKFRNRQGSNLRGQSPLDFKSNALTTRPRLLPDIYTSDQNIVYILCILHS